MIIKLRGCTGKTDKTIGGNSESCVFSTVEWKGETNGVGTGVIVIPGHGYECAGTGNVFPAVDGPASAITAGPFVIWGGGA